MTGNTDHFDSTLRAHHAAALTQVSPQVQAQLAQRRNAALRGTPARPRHGLRYAAASFAAVGALAIGLRLYAPPTPPLATATSTAVVTQNHAPIPAISGTGTGTTTAAVTAATTSTPSPSSGSNPLLEEDPSFYAWLSTSDVPQLAME